MIYALRPYLACQYCTLSSEPLYIANTFSFHSGFHGFDAGSCKEKTDQNRRPLKSVTISRHFSRDLSCKLDIAEASKKLFDCVVRDGVGPPEVGERLILDRNEKVPGQLQVSVGPKHYMTHEEQPEFIRQERPHSSYILFPVSWVDGDERLTVKIQYFR